MAAKIQIVDETPMESAASEAVAQVSTLATPAGVVRQFTASTQSLDPRIPAIVAEVQKDFRTVEARLQALEGAIQGLPRAHTIVRALLASLGMRVLAFLALLGCLGLATVEAYSPSWPLLATFGMLIIGVLLPLVYVSYRGN